MNVRLAIAPTNGIAIGKAKFFEMTEGALSTYRIGLDVHHRRIRSGGIESPDPGVTLIVKVREASGSSVETQRGPVGRDDLRTMRPTDFSGPLSSSPPPT